MDVQVVHNQMPSFGLRGSGDQPLQMSHAIFFTARWPPRWFDDPASGHIEIDEPGESSMPDILKLPPQNMAWEHRQIGMFALQRLHPSHLIHTHRAFSLFRSLGCESIHLTTLHNFLFPLLISLFCQPIAEPMGLEAPFLRSRAACRGEIWVTMPSVFISSAISLPVHWLMGRPAFAGASQASAAIWQRCSRVKVGATPGRGASCNRSLKLKVSRSIPWKATQRSRHRRAVSTLISRSQA